MPTRQTRLLTRAARSDEDGVEILGVEQAAVVGEWPGAGRIGDGLLRPFAEDVADRSEVDLIGFLKNGCDVAAVLAGSDQAELHALVGAQDTCVREGREGGGLHSFPAGQHNCTIILA
jgi:hypothetical protein